MPQFVMLCRRWAQLQCFAGRTGRTAGCCVAGKRAQYRNIRPFPKNLRSQILVLSPYSLGSSHLQPGEGPSRGLLRDYEPSDGTFSSTNHHTLVTTGPGLGPEHECPLQRGPGDLALQQIAYFLADQILLTQRGNYYTSNKL